MAFDGGGTKKFLYTGPNKSKREEEDDWDFSSCKKTSTPNQDFDFALSQVWSIKKNVTIDTKTPQQQNRSGLDNLNLNVGKSYYSRYGNLKDNDAKNSSGQGRLNQDGVRPHGNQKTYSYSYGNNTNTSSPNTGSTPNLKNGRNEATIGKNSVRTNSLGSMNSDPFGNTTRNGTGASRYF